MLSKSKLVNPNINSCFLINFGNEQPFGCSPAYSCNNQQQSSQYLAVGEIVIMQGKKQVVILVETERRPKYSSRVFFIFVWSIWVMKWSYNQCSPLIYLSLRVDIFTGLMLSFSIISYRYFVLIACITLAQVYYLRYHTWFSFRISTFLRYDPLVQERNQLFCK